MTYHYARRLDKNGNLLLTSYSNAKSAEKYGGADADITNTVYYAQFADANKKLSITENAGDRVVRSYMSNASPSATTVASGTYRLWGKTNGVWYETEFAFDSYGAANTLMKAVIVGYEAMLVVQESGSDSRPAKADLSRVDMNAL